ncbi:hypothetical protein BDQ12DRAFT_737112 [Crucibulum laeve]|uniref:Uncharacterized protein n=1 Tax=Crucibulum laeve TaxID=68775 RepID=A0A5C3LTK5_9AGAR|nr:hypothetical protein BDQ12DRAFT_737112 [Crucibulum laeve]
MDSMNAHQGSADLRALLTLLNDDTSQNDIPLGQGPESPFLAYVEPPNPWLLELGGGTQYESTSHTSLSGMQSTEDHSFEIPVNFQETSSNQNAYAWRFELPCELEPMNYDPTEDHNAQPPHDSFDRNIHLFQHVSPGLGTTPQASSYSLQAQHESQPTTASDIPHHIHPSEQIHDQTLSTNTSITKEQPQISGHDFQTNPTLQFSFGESFSQFPSTHQDSQHSQSLYLSQSHRTPPSSSSYTLSHNPHGHTTQFSAHESGEANSSAIKLNAIYHQSQDQPADPTPSEMARSLNITQPPSLATGVPTSFAAVSHSSSISLVPPDILSDSAVASMILSVFERFIWDEYVSAYNRENLMHYGVNSMLHVRYLRFQTPYCGLVFRSLPDSIQIFFVALESATSVLQYSGPINRELFNVDFLMTYMTKTLDLAPNWSIVVGLFGYFQLHYRNQ